MKFLALIALILLCGCSPTIHDDQLRIIQCSERSWASDSSPQYSYLVQEGNGTSFYVVTNKKFQVGDFINISVEGASHD